MLALDTATLAAKTRGFSEEVNGLGATAAAARLSTAEPADRSRDMLKMVRQSFACLADEVGRRVVYQ